MCKVFAAVLLCAFIQLSGQCAEEPQITGEWNGKARADGVELGVQFDAKQQGNQIEGFLTVYGAGGVSKHSVVGEIDEKGKVIRLHDTDVEKISGRRKFTPVLIEEYEFRLKDEDNVLTGTCKTPAAEKTTTLSLEKRMPLGIMSSRANDPDDDHDREYVEKTKKAYEIGEQAKKLVIAEKYAEAEALYREGVKLGENGNAASMHCDLGVVLEMQKRYEEAKAEFQEAIRIDSKYATAIFNLATCYLNSGDGEEAKTRFTKFIAEYPDAVDKPEAIRLLTLLNNPSLPVANTGELKPKILAAKPDEKFEVIPEESNAVSGFAGDYAVDDMDDASDQYVGEHADYYKDAIKKATFRWGKNDLPIKVYIETGEDVRGYRYAFREQLIDAFNVWIKAAQNRLSWKLVSKKEEANIVCSWISDKSKFQEKQFLKQGETYLLGRASNEEGLIASATIKICTNSVFGVKKLRDADIGQICRHEVGHALGIYGHSRNKKDTMYPKTNAFLSKHELTERDIETINRLYACYPVSTASLDENNKVE